MVSHNGRHRGAQQAPTCLYSSPLYSIFPTMDPADQQQPPPHRDSFSQAELSSHEAVSIDFSKLPLRVSALAAGHAWIIRCACKWQLAHQHQTFKHMSTDCFSDPRWPSSLVQARFWSSAPCPLVPQSSPSRPSFSQLLAYLAKCHSCNKFLSPIIFTMALFSWLIVWWRRHTNK